MRLSQFLRERAEPILEDWTRFARSLPAASRFDDATLRDHAAGILQAIAADLEHPQDARHQEEKSKGMAPQGMQASEAREHGSARLLDGFTVNDAVAEFRALRASVLKHLAQVQDELQLGDITELTRFNEAIDQAIVESLEGFSVDKERSDSLAEALLAASPDLAFVVDLEGKLLYGNAALAAEFGQPLSMQRGQAFAQLEAQAARDFQDWIGQAAATGLPVKGELVRNRAGEAVVYEVILVAVATRGGAARAVAGSARDVTRRKLAEEQLRHGAHYDHLTGLPNRYLFRDRLEHELKRAGRIHLPLALLYIDLDGFKAVNDQFGHASGDDLLRQCAQRISACVRESDTVARLAGDEFTAIVTELAHLPHVDVIAQHILDELSRTFTVFGRELSVSGSIGMSLFPRDAGNSDELIRHADEALYAAKENGRNTFRFFTEEMRAMATLRMHTIAQLRQAIASGQLGLFYQPIVELDAGTIVGAEAQLRWHHPTRGLLPASEFFPLAVEAGLAVQIDEWVMGEALDRADEWNCEREPPLYVSINLSKLVVTGKSANSRRQALLQRMQRAASPFALELTETMVAGRTPAAQSTFTEVADAGGHIYLDDFGSGTSSISALATDGLTGIKIDAAIVHGLAQAPTEAIVAGIISIAHGLGLKVVAEGVETAAQHDMLRQMGCDCAQGFHFFYPMPAQNFAALIGQHPSSAP